MIDRALLAIVSSFSLVLLATLVGYYEGDGWDTISDMITRSPRLRNAFALFVGFLCVAHYYYCTEMLRRWERYGWTVRVEKAAVWLGMLVSFGGAVGFAIVSTDDNQKQHMYFAAVAFSGMWLYIFVFYWMACQVRLKATHGRAIAPIAPSMAGATVAMVAMSVSAVALAFTPSWMHYVEYTFVISTHLAAACLCMPAQPPGMYNNAMLLVPVATPLAVPVPHTIDVSCAGGRHARLQWVGPALQWLTQDQTGQWDVVVSCVRYFHRKGLTLDVHGDNHEQYTSNLLNEAEVAKVQKVASYYNIQFNSND